MFKIILYLVWRYPHMNSNISFQKRLKQLPVSWPYIFTSIVASIQPDDIDDSGILKYNTKCIVFLEFKSQKFTSDQC